MSFELDKKLLGEFEWAVSIQVGKHYKKGLFGKPKVNKWQLVKTWNSPQFKVGIPGEVREKLGEEKATRLFQDTVDKIANNPTLLELAVKEYRAQNIFNQP